MNLNSIFTIKKTSKIIGILLPLFTNQNTFATNVFYEGSIQSIKKGDYSAKVFIKEFSKKENLYAIGPVENLEGEITIIDNKYYISSVKKDKIITSNNKNTNAIFLVWSQVKDWKDPFQLNSKINSNKEFQNQLEILAKKSGIDINKPFVFKATGRAESIKYHILSSIFSNQSKLNHRDAAKNLLKENVDIEIIGFYSKKHEGIFTHSGSYIHFHVIDESGNTGHVDNIILNKNNLIYFPKS